MQEEEEHHNSSDAYSILDPCRLAGILVSSLKNHLRAHFVLDSPKECYCFSVVAAVNAINRSCIQGRAPSQG